MNRNRYLNVLKKRRIKNIRRKHNRIDEVITIVAAVIILAIVSIGMFVTMYLSVGGI